MSKMISKEDWELEQIIVDKHAFQCPLQPSSFRATLVSHSLQIQAKYALALLVNLHNS